VLSWLYFVFLLAAAWVAADPASLAELVTCASAYVSGTVMSQASGLLLNHGRMVLLLLLLLLLLNYNMTAQS